MPISPEDAANLLEANAANLVKGVASGKLLSAQQQAMLEALAAGKPIETETGWAKNQVELAKIFDVDRKTIQRWMKQDGCPGRKSDGRYDVAAWKAWRNGGATDAGSEQATLNQTQLKARQILLQNKRLEHKIAQERKEWIPRDLARRVFSQLINEAKSRSFNSIIRIVTISRTAPTTTDAAEEVRKEIEAVWHSLETCEWFIPTAKPAPPKP